MSSINNLGNYGNFNFDNSKNNVLKNAKVQKSEPLLPQDVINNFNNQENDQPLIPTPTYAGRRSGGYSWRDSKGNGYVKFADQMTFGDYLSYGWAWLNGRAN